MAIGIGTGIYTPREAFRLTGLSVRQVKGWISGYEKIGARPLIARDQAGGCILSFLDLIEILFVKSFLSHGVTMNHIRGASKKAMELYGGDHPFAVRRFETDGTKIFATGKTNGSSMKRVLGLIDGQAAFHEVVSPFFKQIEYRGSGDATRWWPLGKEKPILLDPGIAFGAPVTKTAHVPTSAINGALSAGESPARVAKWFEIPLKDVRAAAAFERQMAA
jgi:uncharacterized protein (DUF433 family)